MIPRMAKIEPMPQELRRQRLNPATGQLQEVEPRTPEQHAKMLAQLAPNFTKDLSPHFLTRKPKRSATA